MDIDTDEDDMAGVAARGGGDRRCFGARRAHPSSQWPFSLRDFPRIIHIIGSIESGHAKAQAATMSVVIATYPTGAQVVPLSLER